TVLKTSDSLASVAFRVHLPVRGAIKLRKWALPRRSADARGWRAKIGVIAPSTNTIVQPDMEDIRIAIPGGGVTNHVGRIMVPNASLATDEDFARFQAFIGPRWTWRPTAA
ncbi:unnamed protein product, partial [Polarella glacialis]